MRTFFSDKLAVDDADLHVTTWDEICVKLIELQRTARLCIVKDQLTAHDIANRIMRKDNFLIALVNRDLLPLQPVAGAPSLMSKALEWNLYVAILDAMFDRQFRIRQAYTRDVGALQRRFVLIGCLDLFLAPFFAIFSTRPHGQRRTCWHGRRDSSSPHACPP